MARFLLCVGCSLAWTLLAYGQQSAAPAQASTKLSADPNGAAYGVEYRGAVRGRFSDQFDLYGSEAEPGYTLSIAPLFELHEPRKSHNVLPSQYWRARISLAQSYGWSRAAPQRTGTHASHAFHVRIGALLTHESDHETAHAYSRPGFLALNDAGVRLQMASVNAFWSWYAIADAQLYFLSCTKPDRECQNFRGDNSFGGQLQAGVAWPRFALFRLSPFAALSGSGIVAHRRVRAERRVLGRLGVYARFGDSLLSVFVLGSLGNDVGIVRNRKLNTVGVGLAFAR